MLASVPPVDGVRSVMDGLLVSVGVGVWWGDMAVNAVLLAMLGVLLTEGTTVNALVSSELVDEEAGVGEGAASSGEDIWKELALNDEVGDGPMVSVTGKVGEEGSVTELGRAMDV